jgi:acetolactate synthase-1/2/3 large subunit
MNQLSDRYEGSCQWRRSDVEAVQNRVKAEIQPKELFGDMGLSPFHVLQSLQAVLPQETIVAVDVGAHKMLTCQAWKSTVPGSFLVSNGMSSMGYGVPSALAASLVNPHRPVIGVVGDGGFGMMVQELETAVRMRVKPLLVVFCDRSLAVIKVAQRNRNLPYRGVDFSPVNWAEVAQGFGVKNLWASTLDELSKSVGDWLKNQELTVIAVPIDEDLYEGLTY